MTVPDELERAWGTARHYAQKADIWRGAAIALASRLAEEVSDPTCYAVTAYNHARNGRMTEADRDARLAEEAHL